MVQLEEEVDEFDGFDEKWDRVWNKIENISYLVLGSYLIADCLYKVLEKN